MAHELLLAHIIGAARELEEEGGVARDAEHLHRKRAHQLDHQQRDHLREPRWRLRSSARCRNGGGPRRRLQAEAERGGEEEGPGVGEDDGSGDRSSGGVAELDESRCAEQARGLPCAPQGGGGGKHGAMRRGRRARQEERTWRHVVLHLEERQAVGGEETLRENDARGLGEIGAELEQETES